MSVLPVGFGASGPDTGDITKSLRFRASGSTYMSRIFGTPTSGTIWTFSAWVKRAQLGALQYIFSSGTSGSDESNIYITAADKLQVYNYPGSNTLERITTQVFRDVSSHFHLVVASNGSTSFTIYINGVAITAFDTSTGTNATAWKWANGYSVNIGRRWNATGYLDGYLSRICFVDGQALTPSSFGYLNTEINEWVTLSRSACKAVVDAGGTNSFMLDFEDGTSLTTLGNDYSAKNNDWTLTNHSLTAGVTYDWMEDRPGNSFPIANPLYNGGYGAAVACSNANLTITTTNASATWLTNAYLPTTGKYYFEFKFSAIFNIAGCSISTRGYWSNATYDGAVAYGASYTTAHTIGCAVDIDSSTLEWFKDNVSQGVQSSVISAGAVVAFAAVSGAGTTTLNLNFGQRPPRDRADHLHLHTPHRLPRFMPAKSPRRRGEESEEAF